MKNTSNILIGLLAGLAAGATLGILLAPDGGSGTRNRLSQSFKELGEVIKDKAAEELNKFAGLKYSLLGRLTGGTEDLEDWQNEQEKV